MVVDCHVGESNDGSLMQPSLDQVGNKRKMVVDCHVGESSDTSSALKLCRCGSRSKKLAQCLGIYHHLGKSNDCSAAVSFRISEELIQQAQEITQLVVPEIATPTQISFRNECDLAVDWSKLEEDVLVRIAENHLHSLDDFFMFSSVCRSWHRAAAVCRPVKLNKKWIHNQMPWLMLTDGKTETDKDGYSESAYVLPRVLNDIEKYDNVRDCVKGDYYYGNKCKDYTRGVFNLKSHKLYNIICREGCGRVCWGSAYGWIVTAGGDGKMFMFDPVTKSRVDLPSFGTFRWRWDNEDEIRRNRFVTKAVVLKVGGDDDAQSCGDGVEDLPVVAFYGNDHVAIVKPGNRRWVEIEGEARTYSPLTDVTYDSKLGLVFVDNSGSLFCCNVPEKDESPFLKWFQRPVESIHEGNDLQDIVMTYIVKCGADLLMLTSFIDFDIDSEKADHLRERGYFFVDNYMTSSFCLYKYDFDNKNWVALRDPDVALYVGNNASMWVDEPGGGSVYFTDDLRSSYHETRYKLGGHDCGVYKFRRNRIIHLFEADGERSSYCCPLFFKPSICVPKGLG